MLRAQKSGRPVSLKAPSQLLAAFAGATPNKGQRDQLRNETRWLWAMTTGFRFSALRQVKVRLKAKVYILKIMILPTMRLLFLRMEISRP